MRSVATRLGAAALVLAGALAIAVGVFLTVESFKTIDASTRCAVGARGECMSREPGIVQRADESGIRVGYGDGRSLEVTQRGSEYPSRGAEVIIERWDGEVVAIVDRSSERRYRTLDWPSHDSLLPAGVVLAFGITPFVVLVSEVRRRARAAARPR